jgi:hypothetical protein
MAEIIIKLRQNKKTGKVDVHIDYESDADALPFEHEQDHREIVRELLGDDAFDPGMGEIIVNRAPAGPAKTEEGPKQSKQAVGQS